MRAVLTQEVGVAATDVDLDGRALCRAYETLADFDYAPPVGDGWTTYTPDSNSRVIYVSAVGNDGNDGTNEGSPLLTISAGVNLLRDGNYDFLLLREGDHWTGGFPNMSISGASTNQPMVIGSYGSDYSNDRPRVSDIGVPSAALLMSGGSVNHFVIKDIAFDNGSNDGTASNTAVDWIANGSNIRFENVLFAHFQRGLDLDPRTNAPARGGLRNVTVHRCQFTDNWADGEDGQGLFCGAVQGRSNAVTNITVSESMFDFNGWYPAVFNNSRSHNCYMVDETQGITWTENVSVRGGNAGAQIRRGGTVTYNLHSHNGTGITLGIVQGGGGPTPGGVNGTMHGNVVQKGQRRSAAGTAIIIGNLTNGTFTENVVSHYDETDDTTSTGGFALNGSIDPSTAPDVGINNITVASNLIWKYPRGFRIQDTNERYSNLTIRNNNVQVGGSVFTNAPADSIAFNVPAGMSTNVEIAVWSSNTWESPNSAAQLSLVGGGYSTLTNAIDQWSGTNDTELGSPTSFTDTNRHITTYVGSLLGTNDTTITNAMSYFRAQRRGNWSTNYEALTVINWIRAGFDLTNLSGD